MAKRLYGQIPRLSSVFSLSHKSQRIFLNKTMFKFNHKDSKPCVNIDISKVAKNFKMVTFRAGKLARKENGRFQSTAIKSKTRNFLDSRKTKSRVIALMMLIKRTFQSDSESETALLGRRVVEGSSLVCFLFSPKQGW